MDKPTRTLLVIGDSKLIEDFKNKSDIREIYNHPKVKNAFIIIFYDIRKSESYFKDLKQNTTVFYTISKYEVPQEPDKCDESKNQGTVYITLRSNNKTEINDNEFMNYLNGFGEIKEVKLTSGLIKCIEYYDTRSSKKVREALNNKNYEGNPVTVRNVWDLNSKTRSEIFNKIENELHKFELPEVKDKRKKIVIKKNIKIPFSDLFDEFITENLDLISKKLIK